MRVLLVSKGDARSYRTWSGVPRIILNRLLDDGHDVKLLNLFEDFWFHLIGAFWNVTHDFRKREFETTEIGGWLMARIVRKAARGCEKVLALTYALDANEISVPVELMHDWTQGYFWKRYDDVEWRMIERMRHAERVSCFYPESARYLQRHGINVDYIGLPVEVPKWVLQRTDRGGSDSQVGRYVVFASPWHKDNLEEALIYLEGTKFHLDVIGAKGDSTEYITYHGYLNKDNETEANKYWNVLTNADCLLALGRTWPGGSSIAEAKACGCKIVTRDWPDLQDIV